MNRAVNVLEEAASLHQQGGLDRAHKLYQQHLKAAPRDFDGCYLLAMLECQAGRCHLAVKPLAQLIQEQPHRLDVLYTLGRAHHELDAHSLEALRQLRADYVEVAAVIKEATLLNAVETLTDDHLLAAAAGYADADLAEVGNRIINSALTFAVIDAWS